MKRKSYVYRYLNKLKVYLNNECVNLKNTWILNIVLFLECVASVL